jgi:YHS domain-containing protein
MRFLLIVLSWFLIFLSALSLVRGLLRKVGRSTSNAQGVRRELKRDPVCGTYVAEDISLKTRVGQEVLHFCSRNCQQEYLSLRK